MPARERPFEAAPGAAIAPQELAALVARAADGDVAAFERLIAGYQRRIFGFAMLFAPDRDEAADLAQEALVKVYRSIASFRFKSSFTTWLYQIVKNTFLDHEKSRAAQERRLGRSLDDEARAIEGLGEAALAEDLILREESRGALSRAVARVPEAYRAVLVLFDVQGLAYDEIAQVLGVPVGTVKSRLKRGRDALREEIFRGRAAVEAEDARALELARRRT